MGDLTPHFSREEFACPCGCGSDYIDMGLVRRLEVLRVLVDAPIYITSGVRCPEYNASLVDSVKDSTHITGEAADFEVAGSPMRFEVLSRIPVLFKRIGEGNNFFHVDVSETKPQGVAWTYY